MQGSVPAFEVTAELLLSGTPVSALANALSCRSCRVFIFIPVLLHTAPEGTWKPICSTGSVSIALRALN